MLTSIMGIWKETKRVSKEYHERERKEREEKRERLAFSGRYNELFYGFIWKNFKSSWKDYILLFLCSSMVFAFIVIGFGMQAILSRGSRYEGMSQVFGGLSTILKNAVLPMGMISVIIIVILVFNYLRCRAKNYGIFLTLGMRKRTLKYFVAVEFAALLVLTLAVGGAAGTGCLALFCLKSEGLIGSHVGMSAIGALTYVKAMGVLFLIFLISFMAARDIFMDFNMGRSMKKAMNGLVMLVSLTVYLVLLNVKMATESDMAARRMEFLQCMGMRAVCLGAIGMIVPGMVEVYVRKAEGKGEKNGKRN